MVQSLSLVSSLVMVKAKGRMRGSGEPKPRANEGERG